MPSQLRRASGTSKATVWAQPLSEERLSESDMCRLNGLNGWLRPFEKVQQRPTMPGERQLQYEHNSRPRDAYAYGREGGQIHVADGPQAPSMSASQKRTAWPCRSFLSALNVRIGLAPNGRACISVTAVEPTYIPAVRAF